MSPVCPVYTTWYSTTGTRVNSNHVGPRHTIPYLSGAHRHQKATNGGVACVHCTARAVLERRRIGAFAEVSRWLFHPGYNCYNSTDNDYTKPADHVAARIAAERGSFSLYCKACMHSRGCSISLQSSSKNRKKQTRLRQDSNPRTSTN